MQIEQETDGKWTVISDTGNTYTVDLVGNPEDTDGYQCDCMAGQWGKVCKHIRAVMEEVTING